MTTARWMTAPFLAAPQRISRRRRRWRRREISFDERFRDLGGGGGWKVPMTTTKTKEREEDNDGR